MKTEKYHPYKVYLVQELLEDDYVRRLKIWVEMMRRCVENKNTFYPNGVVDRHNYRLWKQENPH